MQKITMYNPLNHIIIETIMNFKSQWEKLGFKEVQAK